MDIHMVGGYPYTCLLCNPNERIKQKSTLRDHMKEKHGLKQTLKKLAVHYLEEEKEYESREDYERRLREGKARPPPKSAKVAKK